MTPNPDGLIKYLDFAFDKIIQKLKQKNFTRVELTQLAAQIDFLDELKALGFEKKVNDYFAQYDKTISDIMAKAIDAGVKDISAITINEILLIKELDKNVLLGQAADWANRFEAEMVKGILGGFDTQTIINNLADIPLTTTQLNTVLHTSSQQFNRLVTKKAYAELPEQRFRYVGGLIPTSSEICKDLIENQKPEGYTAAEIEAGIPAGGGIVNWGGRVPNFNCIHRWQPIGV